jgi:hypothetical protein
MRSGVLMQSMALTANVRSYGNVYVFRIAPRYKAQVQILYFSIVVELI